MVACRRTLSVFISGNRHQCKKAMHNLVSEKMQLNHPSLVIISQLPWHNLCFKFGRVVCVQYIRIPCGHIEYGVSTLYQGRRAHVVVPRVVRRCTRPSMQCRVLGLGCHISLMSRMRAGEIQGLRWASNVVQLVSGKQGHLAPRVRDTVELHMQSRVYWPAWPG